MKMLKTKHFRRLAVFLAMVAPAVYLFGVSFNALAGAHGEQILAQVDNATLNYTVDDWRIGYTTSTNFGVYNTSSGPGRAACYIESQYSWTVDMPVLPAGVDVAIDIYNPSGFYSSSAFLSSGQSYTSVSGLTKFGFIFRYSDDLDFVPVPLVLRSIGDFTPNQYSETLFGSFFPRDNFLVQWGRNAISDEPYGFAPFGAFWRYLDLNVLHLSNDQVGLMAYGYMYYACHVLLFDVAFILVTFFLDFIQKVNDKVVGGAD